MKFKKVSSFIRIGSGVGVEIMIDVIKPIKSCIKASMIIFRDIRFNSSKIDYTDKGVLIF